MPTEPTACRPTTGRAPRAGWALLGLLLTAPCPFGPARADELLDLPFDDLLQVEVASAGKRDEQIRNIPASVSILTREEIARYGYVTLEDLLRNVPGFFILDNTEDRFIGNRGTVGGGVQFLVNGIPQHPSRQKGLSVPEIARLNIPVESIDRIEVIRGPMSVIYGNNAFLGVINIVTNSLATSGPRASVSAGSRDSGQLFARLGGRARDGFLVLNAGGWRTDGLGGDYADMMSPAQLAALDPAMHRDLDGDLWQRRGSLDLSAGWRGFSTDVRYSEMDYGIYALTPPFDQGSALRLKTLHAALGYAYRFSDNLGLRLTGIHSQETYDAYRLDLLFAGLEGSQRQHARRWELEFDLHWQPDERLSMLFGYRWRLLDHLDNRPQTPPIIVRDIQSDALDQQDLFTEIGYDLTKSLRLVGGARLTQLPEAYRFTQYNALDGTLTETALPTSDRNLINGRVAALWSLDSSQVLKLIWGNAAQDVDSTRISDPERIETVELNYVRTAPRWTLSASLFQNRTSSIVRTIQTLDPATGAYGIGYDNSGLWLTRGLEWTTELRPWPGVNLSLDATWQQTDDRRSDLEPGYSPALLVKLKADYRRGDFIYAAYAHYVDAMESDWDFVTGPIAGVIERLGERVPATWNLGLNLRWEPSGQGVYAALNVSNLLNTEIRYPASELTNLARGLIGPGRILTATLGYAF
ncbi:TonB-dependent receptor [Thiorhodococcus mannitoliphagus]|uniref:TonB-dependent receptor n=1 Tax=Thiorhodococcus mannitoliphagus TaxID=329406 RepID=A0A6P1DVB2_9GAMM|nr:TonB-dependent receptor plug domain-containing protein [Thiorhodococcus mannitoliphagus]NEX22048.1 TonB-dependent receptor [Thiorhodococcus mannitoliphagus]